MIESQSDRKLEFHFRLVVSTSLRNSEKNASAATAKDDSFTEWPLSEPTPAGARPQLGKSIRLRKTSCAMSSAGVCPKARGRREDMSEGVHNVANSACLPGVSALY